jgi:hypothetical protein
MLQAGAQNCDDLIGHLRGHVMESWMDTPLAGATVYISPTLVTVTDADGYYSFTLPVGVYTVTASLDGYEPQTVSSVQVGFGQAELLDFHLAQTVLELTKSVGMDANVCATSDHITVSPGPVTYCFELYNNGEYTLTVHDLADSQLGVIWSGYDYAIPPQGLAFITQTVDVTETVVNTATWTAMDEIGRTFIDLDTAEVVVGQPSFELHKTVGVDPQACSESDSLEVLSGTEVTYCYEVVNTGLITFTEHDLLDDQLGLLFSGYPLELAPGEGTTYLTSTVVETNVTNHATWTAHYGSGLVLTETSSASVNVVEESDLLFTKTVGLNPNACSQFDELEVEAGSQVTYCYQVMNRGNTPFMLHSLVDTQLGDLLIDFPYELNPGETIFITKTTSITESVINTATWTASTEGGTFIQVIDTAGVMVVETPQVYQVFLPVVSKEN